MKPYPDANHYESDVDYKVACINYSESSIKGAYRDKVQEAMKNLRSDIENTLYDFEFEIEPLEDEIYEHIDEIERLLNEAVPRKCVDLY